MILGLLLAFAALLVITYGAGQQAILNRVAAFYAFAQQHIWLLLALYLVRLLFLMPASLLLIVTGMLCGPILGEMVAIIGLTLGGAVEFLIMRHSYAVLGRWITLPTFKSWQARINRAPFHSILLMRVCMLPFDMVNLAAALARVPLRAFVSASLIGLAPTSLPIVMAGASVRFDVWFASGRLLPGFSAINWWYIALSIAIIIVTMLHARRLSQLM
jgi:uncharacterized membrane protein YdjX (TVP38/TMEM64 family)